MSKRVLTPTEQKALATKLFAAAYDRLWRRSAARKGAGALVVSLDDVRKVFAETTESIGTRSFLPPPEDR